MNVETLARLVRAGVDVLPRDTKNAAADLIDEAVDFLDGFSVAFDKVSAQAQPAPSESEGMESGGSESLSLNDVVGIMYDYLKHVDGLTATQLSKGRELTVREYPVSVAHQFKDFMHQWSCLHPAERARF